ncbi:uncharacterized protein LODBEIA_P55580 [Lodderomyces beijingensis]|uniref:Derlin n=1 Tax=Lodderomyces beijingensis TaxID=1775926 RepID=A0ABP0ZT73_9ASCO
MDAVLANLPPVTKGWCIATITASLLIASHKIKHSNLLFMPGRAWSTQNWRLITSFITFGPLSFDLIFTLWQISSRCSKVETSFQTTAAHMPLSVIDSLNARQRQVLTAFIHRNKSLDFLWFFIQVSASVLVVATVVHYRFQVTMLELGQVLISALVYIDSKLSPHEQINFFGVFQLSNSYYPFLSAAITLLSSNEWVDTGSDIFGAGNGAGVDGVGGVGRGMWNTVKKWVTHPLMYYYLMSYGLGHFWWCCREFLLSSPLHYEEDERKRQLRRQTLLKYGIKKFDLVREALVILLLPPWYWIILSKIKQDRM